MMEEFPSYFSQCWWKCFSQFPLAVNVPSMQSTDNQQGPLLLTGIRTSVNRLTQITDGKVYLIKLSMFLPLSNSTYSVFPGVFPWCGMNCNSDSHRLQVTRTGRVRYHVVVTTDQFCLWFSSEFKHRGKSMCRKFTCEYSRRNTYASITKQIVSNSFFISHLTWNAHVIFCGFATTIAFFYSVFFSLLL